MPKLPSIFEPTLYTPQGINNFSGELFRCFTKGDTLSFRFFMKNEDGSIPDVTDWEVYIVMADAQAKNIKKEQEQNLLEVQIPLIDLATGMFEGEVSDSCTNSLPDGLIYAQAKYVTNTGATHILDMCILEAYPSVTFATL